VAEDLERLASFARALRDEGIPSAPDAVADFCRATALLGVSDAY
jgi:uncharacterized protein with von Willebrand factor type A (vWA) domain